MLKYKSVDVFSKKRTTISLNLSSTEMNLITIFGDLENLLQIFTKTPFLKPVQLFYIHQNSIYSLQLVILLAFIYLVQDSTQHLELFFSTELQVFTIKRQDEERDKIDLQRKDLKLVAPTLVFPFTFTKSKYIFYNIFFLSTWKNKFN